MRHLLLISFLFFHLTLPGYIQATVVNDSTPNIFLEMVGKPYSEYHDSSIIAMNGLLYGDSLSRVKLVRQIKEAASKDNTGEWELNHRIIEFRVRFHESRNGGYTPSSEYTAEDFAEDLLNIAEQAEEEGLMHINKKALLEAADICRIFLQNNERAFNYYMKAASDLETINTKELPIRPSIYREIASLYYKFREYEDAMFYFQKIIDDPYSMQNFYKSYYVAIDGIGLCYRYGFKDYERSDSCFYKILELAESRDSDLLVWEGISKGNIGYNYFLRGELDVALSWLIPAIEKITRFDDFPYLSYRAMNIADIYLKKKNLAAAKKYIDISLDYHAQTRNPVKESYFYDILSKYYLYTGDLQKAILHHDSTMMATSKENEDYSGLVLRRVEQQLRTADNKLNEQRLNAEMTKSSFYKRSAILVSTMLILMLILLVLAFLFYRNMHNAYRELVRHNQSWAGLYNKTEKLPENETEESTNIINITEVDKTIAKIEKNSPEESDIIIMEAVEKIMSEKKLYKISNLTLDMLAKETGYNRYYISMALNRCMNKNFNSYVNDFRIKEAIRLISNPVYTNEKIEMISIESGFSDRSSLHRIFKKATGLSPGSFRKVIREKNE